MEGRDHDAVHFVVDNVAGGAEVDGVDYFIVTVVFVAVEVFGLAAVAWWVLVCWASKPVFGCEKGPT